jgi:hypothetical protein
VTSSILNILVRIRIKDPQTQQRYLFSPLADWHVGLLEAAVERDITHTQYVSEYPSLPSIHHMYYE